LEAVRDDAAFGGCPGSAGSPENFCEKKCVGDLSYQMRLITEFFLKCIGGICGKDGSKYRIKTEAHIWVGDQIPSATRCADLIRTKNQIQNEIPIRKFRFEFSLERMKTVGNFF